MKKLNITKKQYAESKYLTKKYGSLKYVSESGKLFKTDKGHVLKFNESNGEEIECPYCGELIMVSYEDDGVECPGCGEWIEPEGDDEYSVYAESIDEDTQALEELAKKYYKPIKSGLRALREFKEKSLNYAPTCEAEIDDAINNLTEVVNWLEIGSTEGFSY